MIPSKQGKCYIKCPRRKNLMQQIKLRCYIDIVKMEVILYYWERIAKPYTCTVASFSVHLLIIFNLILENRLRFLLQF